jgi:molybdopterin molybdotransferase
VVAVVSTGNELRQAGEVLGEGAINDSNRPMLMALAEAAGFRAVDGGCLPDNESLLARRLLELSVRADLIVSSAGASVGDEDNSCKAALSAGGEVEALRIAMKPGKPAVVGRLGRAAYLGLPGNPVSAFVSWCFLGGAMAAALQGRNWQPPAGVPVPSASRFAHKPGRAEFVPARLLRENGGLSIEILGSGVSAHLKPLTLAEGLVEIAATQGGVEPGGIVLFHAFRNLCEV